VTLWIFALLQFGAFAVVGWAVGDWVLQNRFFRRGNREPDEELDVEWPERMLLSVFGFVVFAVACMVANIVTGGLVFGTPGVVAVLGAAIVLLRLKNGRRLGSVPWRNVALIAIPLVLLWLWPAFVSGTVARSGDTPWHLGWTHQLLNGQPVPQGPAPAEVAANAYPWGFHAFLGALVRAVPGSDVLSALLATQLLLVLSSPLGAACLARRLSSAAGWAAAAAAGGIGGLGWLALKTPAFATSPSEARHGADLVIASPNSVYELFPPPLPRELGLVLLATAGVALAIGLERRHRGLLVLAGIALGVAGLISVPALVAGAAWTVTSLFLFTKRDRLRSAATVFVPAAAVFFLWAGPVIRHLILHGGFVNVSPALGREWPVWTSLAAWGILGPLAALGVLVSRRAPAWRLVCSFAVAAVALLGLAIARGEFDWELAGNATVLHQGRIWPAAHLIAAALAGTALWWMWNRLRAARPARTLLFTALLLVGATSPVLATVSLGDSMADNKDGYPYGKSDFDENSFVRRAAAELGPEDTIRVEGRQGIRDLLAFHIFSFSGVRLADFDDPRLESNDLRIRYEDFAKEWDQTVAEGRFRAAYVIEPTAAFLNKSGLVRGSFGGLTWVLNPASKALSSGELP
jgi:hypothetical protein